MQEIENIELKKYPKSCDVSQKSTGVFDQKFFLISRSLSIVQDINPDSMIKEKNEALEPLDYLDSMSTISTEMKHQIVEYNYDESNLSEAFNSSVESIY